MSRAFLNAFLAVCLMVLCAYGQAASGQYEQDHVDAINADGTHTGPITTEGWNLLAASSKRHFIVSPGILAEVSSGEEEGRCSALNTQDIERHHAPLGAIPAMLGAQRSALVSLDVLDQDAFRASAPPAYLCHRVFRI